MEEPEFGKFPDLSNEDVAKNFAALTKMFNAPPAAVPPVAGEEAESPTSKFSLLPLLPYMLPLVSGRFAEGGNAADDIMPFPDCYLPEPVVRPYRRVIPRIE